MHQCNTYEHITITKLDDKTISETIILGLSEDWQDFSSQAYDFTHDAFRWFKS